MCWMYRTCFLHTHVCVHKYEMTCCSDIVPVSGPTVSCLTKLVPSALMESMATSNLVKFLLITPTFLLFFRPEKMTSFSQFLFFMHNLQANCKSYSQGLTESYHIFFSRMGIFAFALTVWAFSLSL